MAHTALNFKQRRIQHRWTQQERMLLCCMKRFFDLPNKDMTRIFNHLYEMKIRSEGFSNGLPTSTIVAQWEDIRRKHHLDFNLVHREVSFAQGPTTFSTLCEKIRFACQRLHIGLVSRARDLEITIQERARTSMNMPTQEQRRTINSVGAQKSSDLPSGRQAQEPVMPTMPLQNTQTSEAPPQSVSLIRSFTLQNRKGAEPPARPSNVPTLLWRFSNDESMGINHRAGYIANAFINEIGNIPSPEDRAQEFPTWLEIHVRPRKIPSPFISTSTDPLVPIHRALTRGKNAFVSLIDSSQIDADHIFYMSDLMRQYDIYTPGYRGAKEYVIWGAVGRGAIVISFRADQLISIANEHPDIKAALQFEVISSSPNCKSQLNKKLSQNLFESDLTVGKTIGKFLRLIHLQQEYINDVALALNGSWSFTSSENTVEFIRGVNQGYQDTDEPPPLQNQATPPHSQTSLFSSQGLIHQSQRPATPSQEIIHLSENGPNRPLNDEVRLDSDYVIVDPPQQNVEDSQINQDQQLRQSIDRLSIYDEQDEISVQNEKAITSPFPTVVARTIATRHISLFDRESESWVSIRSPTHDVEPVVPSIERDTEIKQEGQEEEPAGSRTPTPCPIKQRARSESVDSDSTVREQTPRNRLSEERSHIDRVLGVNWQAFWDSMEGFS